MITPMLSLEDERPEARKAAEAWVLKADPQYKKRFYRFFADGPEGAPCNLRLRLTDSDSWPQLRPGLRFQTREPSGCLPRGRVDANCYHLFCWALHHCAKAATDIYSTRIRCACSRHACTCINPFAMRGWRPLLSPHLFVHSFALLA